MNGPVFVTGATGFLGSYVVAALARSGHKVRIIARPGADTTQLPWGDSRAIEVVRADLRQTAELVDAVSGTSGVVHLAAVKSGTFASRFAGTVVGTENLISAMVTAGVERMVYCSSFAVYDYLSIAPGTALTETSPIESQPLRRDDYAQVKLAQERLVEDWARGGGRLTVLRPGMIYGPGKLWHALLGIELAQPLWLGVGWLRKLPMTWVENVADAFVAAVDQGHTAGATVNIVDDDLPSVAAYLRAVGSHMAEAPRLLSLPYPIARTLVGALGAANSSLLGEQLKLPSGLLPASFAARFRPLHYPNDHARATLNWRPRIGMSEALLRTADSGRLLRAEPT